MWGDTGLAGRFWALPVPKAENQGGGQGKAPKEGRVGGTPSRESGVPPPHPLEEKKNGRRRRRKIFWTLFSPYGHWRNQTPSRHPLEEKGRGG